MRVLYTALFLCLAITAHAAESPKNWVIYYGNALPADEFQHYDVIVFDSDNHPALTKLQAAHKTLLGYLSLGEAEDYRSYYQALANKNLLLQENPQWRGHRVIDIRKPEWEPYVNNVLIPQILSQGFDGIMADTLDSVIDLENADPKKYAGMKQAAINLIKSIRAHYPNIKIMVNRGFVLLPDIAPSIDMVMAESIYTDWQPGKKPALTSSSDFDSYVALLHNAQTQSPSLKIYTVDYWPPHDKKGIRRIYSIQRGVGFVPYVSTPNLQAIYPEP